MVKRQGACRNSRAAGVHVGAELAPTRFGNLCLSSQPPSPLLSSHQVILALHCGELLSQVHAKSRDQSIMFGKSKSPKPVPTLPTELVEMIIGYMPSDAFSLSQRCLVCKDWRQRFQPALFAHILLIDADEAEAFRTAVQSSHELGLCAQTIKITCRPQSYKGRFWLDKYYEMGTTWGLCTNIKTLILSEVSLMITPRKPLDVRAFHHVKRLELSSVMVSKLNGLNLVLSQLTVESLLLESVYVNDSSVSLPAPDSVRDIELCQLYASSSINDAASWQEYGRALAVLFPYVTTVAVQVNNGGDEVTVRQWVERMDQRLERLTLRVSSGAENGKRFLRCFCVDTKMFLRHHRSCV